MGVVVPFLVALIGLIPWLSNRMGPPAAEPVTSGNREQVGGERTGRDVPPPIERAQPEVEARTPEEDLGRRDAPTSNGQLQPPTSTLRQQSVTLSRASRSQFVAFAKTNLSVAFRAVAGEKLATLTITPQGGQSISQAVLGTGVSLDTSSNAGEFRVTVTQLELDAGRISLLIEKK